MAGTRYQVGEGSTRIGRSPENDIVVQGPNSATVSAQHVEIAREDGVWRIRDAGSTNGTFLNGERIAEAELNGEAVIQLGNDGPEFSFVIEEVVAADLDGTLVIPAGILLPPPPAPKPPPDEHEWLLRDAVSRARHARIEGRLDQTMHLMREALQRALVRSRRRSRRVIWLLTAALVLISSLGFWKIMRMKSEKAAIDEHIREIETHLSLLQNSPEQTDRLLSELDTYEGEAETLKRNLLYRVGSREKENFVVHEIRVLMTEFGAEVYSIPPEFVERVNAHIDDYLGPDRPNMERALNDAKGQIATMQQILNEEKLPPDFAFVPLVESALEAHKSSAGAVGPWQFTPATARAYGLRVDGTVDERKDLRKSTHAACGLLRTLILDFGSGSSVMLALAAYNLGPARVRLAVANTVEDPIKQRNFWYLYRARALPAETREYVPKVFAAITIGRNPERFGF
jgi:membrane-bound lytic murein transglycosylase D